MLLNLVSFGVFNFWFTSIYIRLLNWTTKPVLKGAESIRQKGQLSGGFLLTFQKLTFYINSIDHKIIVTLGLKVTFIVSITLTDNYFCSVFHYLVERFYRLRTSKKQTMHLGSRILIKLFADFTPWHTWLSRERSVGRKSLWNILYVQDTFVLVSVSGLVAGPLHKRLTFSVQMSTASFECWEA